MAKRTGTDRRRAVDILEKILDVQRQVHGQLGDVKEQLGELKVEMRGVRDEVHELRGDVEGLRGEVHELRGDVGELRGEVSELRGEVGELRGEVRRLGDRFDHFLTGPHREDHSDLRGRVERIERHLGLEPA